MIYKGVDSGDGCIIYITSVCFGDVVGRRGRSEQNEMLPDRVKYTKGSAR